MDQLELLRVALQLAITWVVLVVVLALARRDRLRSEAAVAELRLLLNSRLDAIQQAVEEIGGAPNMTGFAPSTPENWESIRDAWATARRALERGVESLGDGDARAALSAMPRHTYEQIIERLRTLQRLDAPTAETLRMMDRRFMVVRRTRTATADQAEEFARLQEQAAPGIQRL